MKKQKIRSKAIKIANNLNNINGITLIALVVTIIVLLILAAVAINLTIGENGIFEKAQNAKLEYEKAAEKENKMLSNYEEEIDSVLLGNMWNIGLNTLKNSTIVKLEVKSRYYDENQNLPTSLKEYKELYILKAFNTDDKFKSIDEMLLHYFNETDMESLLIKLREQMNDPNLTRDKLVYGILIQNVNNENEALIKIGFSEENIKQIENEYEQRKNSEKTEVPEKYKNKEYKIIYPDGSSQTISGNNLTTYIGEYNATENNKEYIIKIIDNENKEETLKITVKNFVKYTTYEQGDYIYEFSESDNGYKVNTKVKTLEKYGEILSNIDGIPVTSMYNTFKDCTNMKISPTIPKTIKNMEFTYWKCTNLEVAPVLPEEITSMYYTFASCKKLKKAPKIPNNVVNLGYTFSSCSELEEAPEIPQGVKDMLSTFMLCTSLKKTPVIPNTVKNMNGAFDRCSELIEVSNIPEGVENMWNTFNGCKKLIKVPDIPSTVTDIRSIFRNCELLSGEIKINSVRLTGNTAGDREELGKQTLENTGTKGSGLKVIVPNDQVRELIIENSGYNSSKVQIVAE